MRTAEGRWEYRSPFVLVALGAAASLAAWVAHTGRLVGGQDSAASRALFTSKLKFTAIELPLFWDPVGIALVTIALMTPIFLAEQVAAISSFVDMNRTNGLSAVYDRSVRTMLDREAEIANRWFARIGRWYVSLLLAAAAAVVTSLIFSRFSDGMYVDWLPYKSALPLNGCSSGALRSGCQVAWSHAVRDGWWAGGSAHHSTFIALQVVTGYMWYWAMKQWLVGVTFYAYARRTYSRGFGLLEAETNIDGYWGLRRLRRFMQWTYVSTLCHISLFVLVYWIWFGGSSGRVEFGTWFALVGILVVVLPSSIAYKGVVRTRQLRVQSGNISDPILVEATWRRPVLPFRIRNAVTALVVYVILPVAIALLSRSS